MLLHTGQKNCYDEAGNKIYCRGSGQDGEYRIGARWPEPRFVVSDETVLDRLTGLTWSRDANPSGFPVTWQEALSMIAVMNQDNYLGGNDWRLPNRSELRSLMSYQSKKPALPAGHPFVNIFLGWYWTSTSATINPAYAWSIHLEGARMFYGRKDQYYLFWPVRGRGSGVLPRTGQRHCYNSSGEIVSCTGSGQDGEHRLGQSWPAPRFEPEELTVFDRLTNLCWIRCADCSDGPVSWRQALTVVQNLNRSRFAGRDIWRLLNINELESLVDCSAARPCQRAIPSPACARVIGPPPRVFSKLIGPGSSIWKKAPAGSVISRGGEDIFCLAGVSGGCTLGAFTGLLCRIGGNWLTGSGIGLVG